MNESYFIYQDNDGSDGDGNPPDLNYRPDMWDEDNPGTGLLGLLGLLG